MPMMKLLTRARASLDDYRQRAERLRALADDAASPRELAEREQQEALYQTVEAILTYLEEKEGLR